MPDSMKITVKTVKGGDAPLQIECKSEDTILAVKQMVEKEKRDKFLLPIGVRWFRSNNFD